ncbi:hypothetical protein [uncultured Microbulbifer sp.]|uniref:hypothetical protein n=1 Tax=uncultured Microbulbifer sp. TaxID=348147 RepID=UPI002610B19B|nr:hypothetical protein [uncultured Microbulbifer sp.]
MRIFKGFLVIGLFAGLLAGCGEAEKQSVGGRLEVTPLEDLSPGGEIKVIKLTKDQGQVTIYAGETQENFCMINLQEGHFRAGVSMESRQRAGGAFDVTCHWDGGVYVRSNKHETWAKLKFSNDDSSMRLHLVSPVDESYFDLNADKLRLGDYLTEKS